MDQALVIADMSFSYGESDSILQDINLRVDAGDRLGIVGQNGCGKTTLFLLISGLLRPQSGQIRVFGQLIQPGSFYPQIGLVFQNADDQLFSASVWDDVAFGPQNLGLTTDIIRQRVESALAVTGLKALAQRPPHHLSGGQKRMAAIAGILAMEPRLLLYDEPTANLDIRARRRLIQFLQSSQKTRLIASHDLEFLLEVCNRIVVMGEGQLAAQGSPVEILGDQILMETHGLEVPYSLARNYP